MFQLIIPGVRSDFPPIRSLNNCPNNLPVQLTPLIGREHELGHLRELLRRPEVRFVTVSGPGGVGKTLLTLQLASSLLADFADGVFLVTLADAKDPASIAAQIAEAESNIDNVAIGPAQGDPYATITFTLQVLNRLHLAHIMRTLRRTPEVIRIARVKN